MPDRTEDASEGTTRGAALRLSVVLPTFRERGNVAELVTRLDRTLGPSGWEAIFVDDDSPDGTAEAVKEIAATDSRIRCLRRVGRRGLAGACIEGILSSSAPFVAVMDADLQHDERLLPRMLARLENNTADLVVGSRYTGEGDASVFSEGRGFISRLATRLTRYALGTELTDPMSGFFMLRRDRFDPIAGLLAPVGFKILLDIVTVAKGQWRIAEESYVFAARQEGESKFDVQVGLEFLGLLLTKLTGGILDPRFIFFALVGTLGLAVHLAALKAVLLVKPDAFATAQTFATFVAMTSNFFLNNELTYRDRRLKGPSMLMGLVGFYVIGAVGALATVNLAATLFYAEREVWWVAGAAGAIMSALWNYALSSMFIWRTR